MPAVEMSDVTVELDGRRIVDGIDWTVERYERWVVLGPNGSGKTTLLRLASLYLHPTAGTLTVLGERLGRTDVRTLRRRIGVVGAGFAALLRPAVTAVEVVMTGRNGALEPWWHDYDDEDRRRARTLLARVEVAHVAESKFGTLSSGERQRVLLARAMANDPELLLLDEPMAGLDVGGREHLLTTLTSLVADPVAPPLVLVTHHVEEVPRGMTHALVVVDGRVVARGPADRVITSAVLSEAFGLGLTVVRHDDGRYSARAVAG